jgi:hypothetical protein
MAGDLRAVPRDALAEVSLGLGSAAHDGSRRRTA